MLGVCVWGLCVGVLTVEGVEVEEKVTRRNEVEKTNGRWVCVKVWSRRLGFQGVLDQIVPDDGVPFFALCVFVCG